MTHTRRLRELAGATMVLALATACGGSSGYGATSSAPTATTTTSTAAGSAFSVSNVTGLGSVLVDARGRTVYLLTKDDHHNVACTDASGCTKEWPDLPLPDGVSAATAGAGAQTALLGTMKGSDGKTYPTYKGWLMYEFAGDSAAGQANGQGIHSFGGTWYALSAAGTPLMSSSGSTPSGTSGTSGGGYHY